MSYDCFISYQSSDLKFAEQVLEGLLAAGIARERIWFDKERLKPGFEWHKEIERGCESSRILLPVLTPRWQQSPWTRFETYGAESVIPLRFEGRFEEVAPLPLRRFQAHEVDFTGDRTAVWQELAAAMRELLARPAPQRAERALLLRYHRNPNFIGRENELLAIHQQLHDNPTATATQGQVCVIAALGGMGKTTLAREYAEKFWRCYTQILWVDARNPGGLEVEYADLFTVLNPAAGELTQAARAQQLLRQLEGREERLLIIDNAEDEASVQRWLPKSGGCRTLITSRFTDWSAAVGVTRIEALLPEPARQMLLARTGITASSPEELSACDELARQLGFLPLALEQAAAYMRKQRMGFVRYLQRYAQETAALLQKGVLGSTEYPDAVMTTWAATIARLPPVARALLRLASFMASTPIPLSLFIAGAQILRRATQLLREQELSDAHEEFLPGDDEGLIREALGFLADYSMVTMEDESFRVHGLVQTVEQLSLPVGRLALWSLGAVSFTQTCPDDPTDPVHWPYLRQVALHLDHASYAGWTAADRLNRQPDVTDETSPAEIFTWVLTTLTYLGKYQLATGGHALAERYLRLAVDNDRRLPEDHRRTIQALYALSNLLVETDRLEEAIELRRRELALCEAELGAQHPEVAEALLRLARPLADKGEYQQAEQILLRALQITETGETAESAATARNCLYALVTVYQNTGRGQDADRIWQRLDALRGGAPAQDGSQLCVREDLLEEARHQSAAGDAKAAETLLEQFLTANEQAFGTGSDQLAIARAWAAVVYRDIGRYAQAEKLLAEVLRTKQAIYGQLHREVADVWSSIAGLYGLMQRRSDAINAQRIGLKILEHNFPDGHTSIVEGLLALANFMDGDPAEDPEAVLRRAVEMAGKIRDSSHPLSVQGRTALTFLLLARGRLDEAEALLGQTLETLAQRYGAASPQTGELLRDWARKLYDTGQYDRASVAAGRSLQLHEALHGAHSIELLKDLRLIGWIAQRRADWPYYEETLRLALAIADRANADTLGSEWAGLLGMHLRHMQRLEEAEPLLRRAVGDGSDTPEAALLRTYPQMALADLLSGSGRTTEAESFALQALVCLLDQYEAGVSDVQWLSAAAEAWVTCRLANGIAGRQVQQEIQNLFEQRDLTQLLATIQTEWIARYAPQD